MTCCLNALRQLPSRVTFATLALAAFGLVAVGYELQTLLRLSPCPLCIFQRLLYLVIGSLAFCGFLWPALSQLWAGLFGLLAMLGAGVAGYQTWLQAFPHLATECNYADPNAIERLVDLLGMQWPGLFLATGFCSSREWEWLGLSMANWSFLVFCGYAVSALWLLRRCER